jgi:hypothetical protein
MSALKAPGIRRIDRLVLNVLHAEESADPVCSPAGDVGQASAITGGLLHSFERAQRAAMQNGLLREQELLR